MAELAKEVVEVLVRKLGMGEEEVQEEHATFLEAHPEGSITKEQWIASCLERGGSTEEQARALFKVFHSDESGTMDFEKFLMAINASTLRWEF